MSETNDQPSGEGADAPELEGVEGQDGLDTATETEVELDDEGKPLASEDDDDEETEEVEEGGKKYAVPKSLMPRLMQHADYTQKTQALAEQRREHDAQVSARQAEIEAHLQDHVKVATISDQLTAMDKEIAEASKALQNVDWDALGKVENGQMLFTRAQHELQALKDAKAQLLADQGKLKGDLDAKGKARALEAQQAAAKRIEERDAKLKADIPNWDKEKPALAAFAAKVGLSEQEFNATTDVRVFKVLQLAKLGFDAQQRAKTTARAETVAKPIQSGAKPIKVVTGGGTPRTDMNRMSTEGWMKARQQQIAQKRGR